MDLSCVKVNHYANGIWTDPQTFPPSLITCPAHSNI